MGCFHGPPVKVLGISLNITNQVVHIKIMLLPDDDDTCQSHVTSSQQNRVETWIMMLVCSDFLKKAISCLEKKFVGKILYFAVATKAGKKE